MTLEFMVRRKADYESRARTAKSSMYAFSCWYDVYSSDFGFANHTEMAIRR